MPGLKNIDQKVEQHINSLCSNGSAELKELFSSPQYNYVGDLLPISKWPERPFRIFVLLTLGDISFNSNVFLAR